MFKNRSFKISLFVSVALHLLLLLLYRPLTGIARFLPAAETFAAAETESFQPLTFELVETPPDAEGEPEQADFLSDRNARARDMNPSADLEPGLSYSEGLSEYRIFAGGGDFSEQMAQLMQPDRIENMAPENIEPERTDPPENGDLEVQRRENRAFQQPRFSREMLAGTGRRSDVPASSFSDDVNWDNREFSAEDLGGISLNTYAWDFAPYILYMKRRIRNHVYPPPAFYQMGAISGEVVLRFRVHRGGETSDLEMISYKGHKALTETSLNAVRGSSPFRPLPESFPEKYLELTWTFIYSIFR